MLPRSKIAFITYINQDGTGVKVSTLRRNDLALLTFSAPHGLRQLSGDSEERSQRYCDELAGQRPR